MFSIGDTAKLNNITVQTLRHYDKEGLLKPIYVDENNGYRYYSINQFLQIDFIRRYRTLGFSVQEIKNILFSGSSLDSILDGITFQKNMISQEIQRLKEIEKTLNIMERSISIGKENLNENISIKDISFFSLGSYIGDITSVDEIEFAIRKAFKKIKINYEISDTLVILKADREFFEKEKKIIYTELLIGSKTKESGEKVSLKGASIFVEGAVFESNIHYKNLLKFNTKNNFKSSNYFYEIYYISKLDTNNKEYSLINILLPIEK